MERLGISLEGLKSGSIPTISNLPNDLVLDLFKVVKSKKELKIEDLFNWLQKICGKSLNRPSIISKVYKLVKKQKSLKGDAKKKFLSEIFNADAGTCVQRRKLVSKQLGQSKPNKNMNKERYEKLRQSSRKLQRLDKKVKKFKDSNYKLSLEKTSLQREVLKLRKINKKNQTEMEKQVKKISTLKGLVKQEQDHCKHLKIHKNV